MMPCRNEAAHTPCPENYVAWHEWADTQRKTHRQVKCDGCGRFAIWTPR